MSTVYYRLMYRPRDHSLNPSGGFEVILGAIAAESLAAAQERLAERTKDDRRYEWFADEVLSGSIDHPKTKLRKGSFASRLMGRG